MALPNGAGAGGEEQRHLLLQPLGAGARMSSNTLLLEFFPTLAMMAVSLLIGWVTIID